MTRLTTLFVAVALLLPGAALADPIHDVGSPHPGQHVARLDVNGIDQEAAQRKAEAMGRYYASFGAGQAAAPGRDAEAMGRYYASYRNATSLPAPAPAAVATGSDGVSYSVAVGLGVALMLLAGGLGMYAGRTIRPRQIGA